MEHYIEIPPQLVEPLFERAAETGLSVEEIALAVGYENKSYFHRIFSARYGTSPKKYRGNEIE